MNLPRVLPLPETLEHQRASCARLGSALYADLLVGIAEDVAEGGVCAAVLGPHGGDPFATALPLRFLGAVHRLALEGKAPALARHYPSTGGTPGSDLVVDFVASVAERRAEVEARLGDTVQTNEVGRSAVLAPGYALVARRSGLPLRVLELGASGGLNLRWDHYWYDTGETTFGDPASEVRFVGAWQARAGGLPDLRGAAGPEGEAAVRETAVRETAVGGDAVAETGIRVVERAGCDRHPLDVTTEEGRLTLRSYLWPDQVQRRERLEAAFAVAARVPAPVEEEDMGAWVDQRLAEPVDGVVTVLVHTIMWQYVARESRQRMRTALHRAGERATPDAPVAWLRFEPAGPVGDLRLTWWPGGGETVLATAEYHGPPVYWGTATPPAA